MATLPQHRIEEQKDNPIVAALIKFVTDVLKRSLDDISNWNVIAKEDSGYGEFSVKFGDGTEGYRGTIRQGLDGWRVHTFQAVMTVTSFSPTISVEANRPKETGA